MPDQVERFGAIEAQVVSARMPCGELEGDDAHADEVAAMDAFEAFGHDGADAEQAGSFGGPVARGAAAVIGAGDHDQRCAGLADSARPLRARWWCRRPACGA